MSANSVQLHRVLTSPPEKVFRAFSNPVAYANWIPPFGFLGIIHEMNFKEGGAYRMSFVNFTTFNEHFFGGSFLEIRVNELVKYSSKFDDPKLPGEMTTTVRLKDVSCGTEISIVQEGIPTAIPLANCYLGWQESLEKLKKLVEPEIA